MIKKSLILKNERSRQYPTETMMDAHYADELVLFTNTLEQGKTAA